MIKNILIIGSGWLGLSLAKELIKQGFNVKATTTTSDKVTVASKDIPEIVHFDSHFSIADELLNSSFDLIIITIPPKRTDNDYLSQLTSLHALALALNIKRVLFISSTSVWGDNHGIVVEKTTMRPTTNSAKAMVEFERLINKEPHYQATTIKLAGLIGGDRHPGRFLAGKLDVASPDAPVNMVTREDVIGLISAIIKHQQWQQSFIACAPSHPTRKAFYTKAAKCLELTPATFNHLEPEQLGKQIDGSLTATQLNYHYQHADLMQWLNN